MSARKTTVLTIEKNGRVVRLVEVEHRSYTITVDGEPAHSGEESLAKALRIARRFTDGEDPFSSGGQVVVEKRPDGLPGRKQS